MMGWFTKIFKFFSIFFYVIFVNYPSFFIFSILCIIYKNIDKSGNKSRNVIISFLKRHSKIFNLKFIISGLENISFNDSENYLVVSNFDSIVDIIILLQSFPNKRIVPIIRSFNFYIPFFGWAITTADYIPFNNKKPFISLNKITNTIKNKNLSVIHFPAGYCNNISSDSEIPLNYIRIAKKSYCKLLPVKISFIENNEINGSEKKTIYKINYFDPIDISGNDNFVEINKKIFNYLYK